MFTGSPTGTLQQAEVNAQGTATMMKDSVVSGAKAAGNLAVDLSPIGSARDTIYAIEDGDPLGILIGIASIVPQIKAASKAIGKARTLEKTAQVPRFLPDSALVCRGGVCTADKFANGSGVIKNADGTLSGVSTQSREGASLEELSAPFMNNQVGQTTAGQIRSAGGRITSDGTSLNPNHATVDGLTAEQLKYLFTPTIQNPVPPSMRGLR